MGLKYVIDATAIYLVAHVVWSPVDYFFPLIGAPHIKVAAFPTWFQLALLIWTLPFIWIGVTMMLRRATDAGRSAAWCAAFFVPIINYAVMLWLAALPSQPPKIVPPPTLVAESDRYRTAIVGALGGTACALAAILVTVFGLNQYGGPLFVGTPFIQGLVCGWAFNRTRLRTSGETITVVWISLLLVAGVMFLFATEGIFCLAMALPLAAILGIMGGMIGRTIASRSANPAGIAALLFVVPTGSLVDKVTRTTSPLYEVTTVVDVAAPPPVVWAHVIKFDEIRAPLPWYFRAGIAYPISATIAGSGVGAIRRCEFSTGAFVEPITVWDAPRSLAFDVIAQPPPLTELSIYSKVYAPHIDGFFQSQRGEFRLIAMAGGRTRLEGHTWYRAEIYPQAYWRVISELLLHSIHRRVLDAVKREAEHSTGDDLADIIHPYDYLDADR